MRALELSREEAQEAVISSIASGATVEQAMSRVGRALKTYENWRIKYPEFARRVDDVRAKRKAAQERGIEETSTQIGFAQWRKEYLNQDTYRHQQAWIDLLEGREYTPVPGERYEPAGSGSRLVINTPPFHGKSVTLTVEYVTYRICMNPDVRVIIVSKRADQAKKFLYAIKQRLTSSRYAKLQAAYAPPGGFRGRSDGSTWGADKIYVAGRESGEKDPTVEALGIGGQIYGARAELIILDDVVTLANVGEWEKQMNWLHQEVASRLYDGKLLVVGTRMATQDLYSELLNGENYLSGKTPWTYLGQPAILEIAEDPKDWKTLWPVSSQPLDEEQKPEPNGLYRAWDGPRLAEVRDSVPPKMWSLVYMQEQVADEAHFHPTCVWGSVNRRRKPGPLVAGALGHPPRGSEGMWIIASMDPAMGQDGYTFTLVEAVDRQNGRRYVMNAWVKNNPTPAYIRDIIKQVTEEFRVNEWVIEKNAFQLFLVQDPEIQGYLASRGVILTPHYTCVPTDVEILTRTGWKRHDQLTIGEDVLTHEGWAPLQEVNVYDAPEKMYRFKSTNLSCDFTENHRHLVEWRGNASRETRLVETKDLKSNMPIRLTVDPVDGPGIGGEDMAELLGWYITEGSDQRGRNDLSGIAIYQSARANPEKHRRIGALLERMGIQAAVHHTRTADPYYIRKADADRLRALAPGKKVPASLVADMTIAERERFMEACLLGDGHGDVFFSTTLEHLVAFEMAATLNGYAVRRSPHVNGNGRFKSNFPCYKVLRKRTKLAHPMFPGREGVQVVPGEGQVWCPTTGPGTWVARSNGRVFVTGNSKNKTDPDFGVASVAPLFGSMRKTEGSAGRGVFNRDNLIELPDPDYSEGIRALIEQLIAWEPGKSAKKLKQDGPMALWFAELRARVVLGHGSNSRRASFVHNPYLTKSDQRRRVVVPMHEYRAV